MPQLASVKQSWTAILAARTSKLLFATLCLSACSLSQQANLADLGFIVYETQVELGSQRGLAINGEVIALSGTSGSVTWSLDCGNTFIGRLIIDEKLDYRDVEILNDGAIVLMSAGPGEASTVVRVELRGTKTLVSPAFVNTEAKGFWDGMKG